MSPAYEPETITRDQVESLPGATVLQFGTNWCGYCRAAEKVVDPVLEQADAVRRILVEDGKGRPLGRTYGVKLWPTLVFLADGVEVARVVRPWRSEDLTDPMARLDEALADA